MVGMSESSGQRKFFFLSGLSSLLLFPGSEWSASEIGLNLFVEFCNFSVSFVLVRCCSV